MTLPPGTRLGPYEVTAQIGVGGMGEVYRATDTNLKRAVAIKILPESVAADTERLGRLHREAEVLASLNHPNIAAIYGLERSSGMTALVMELVEGPTLADRVAQGAIPVDESLAIARQVAEAIEAAHEQGIIHRDLKPANIKLRTDGIVKVLDFGLAKAMQPAVSLSPSHSQSPTITTPAMTSAGMILGTAANMSPEQATGREVDKRSDVWAFGTVLYELLTGTRAFDGANVSDTIASVLTSEPDWSRVPGDVPLAVRTLMQRCLTKNKLQRVSDISIARFVLTELPQLAATSVAHGTSRHSRMRLGFTVAAVAALSALVVGAAALVLRSPTPPRDSVHFSIPLPELRASAGTAPAVAISPDGTRLAYAANSRIFIRSLKELESHEVTGSRYSGTGSGVPTFAPDGQSLAFFSSGGVTTAESGVTLSRVPIGGGVAAKLSTVDYPYGVSWSANGILIGQGPGGIVRVPATGGAAQQIVKVAAGESAMEPQLLPDGQTILFTLGRAGDEPIDMGNVVAQSTVDGARHMIREHASGGRYSGGHLWYVVGGTVFAVPFDAARLTVTGDPVTVLNGVQRSVLGITQLSLSKTGTAAYVPGPASASAASPSRTLVIGDTRTNAKVLQISPASFFHPRVSPDGRTVVVSRSDGPMSDIWAYDLTGTTEIRRLTFDGTNRFPVWSADSQNVTFQSAREGDRAIWWASARGGTPVRLTRPGADEQHVPECWSRDGRRLLFSSVKNSKSTLWVFTLDTRTSERFGSAESSDLFGANFSPDGKWVVYAANAGPAGFLTLNRGVYVEPFPATGERHQAPKQGLDYHPVWAPDAKQIFYVSTLAGPLVSVPIALQNSVTFGAPTRLARGPRPGLRATEARGFDFLPDGRFVSLAPLPEEGGESRSPELRVLLNWAESSQSARGADSTVASPR
jgi:serine/threonine-protein kinase